MTRRLALHLALAALAVLAGAPSPAQEKLDWATLGRIRDEGFRRSQVMETAGQLTDVHGPRLTGSPQYKEAADWAAAAARDLGPRERPPRELAVRPRLELRALLGARRLPDELPARRAAEGLDRGDERPRARQGPARQGRVGGRRREAEGPDRGDGPLGGPAAGAQGPRGRRRLQALHREAARRHRAVPDPRRARRARPDGAGGPRGLPEAAPGAAGPREALRGREAAGGRRALGARRERPAAGRRLARTRRATRSP